MKRYLISLFGAIALVVGLLGASASPATATEQAAAAPQSSSPEEDCQNEDGGSGTGTCGFIDESESHSRSGGTAKAVSRNGVSIHSDITVLARVRANGTPAAQQDNCWRLANAQSIWTSYDASGTTGWDWKFYPKGYRVCTMDNGAVRDPLCHNMLKIGQPKSKPPHNAVFGQVKLVKRIHWKVVSVSKADEHAVAKAKAWCNTSSANAYAEAKGVADALATARASARGYVLVKLLARVQAESDHQVAAQLGASSLIDLKVKTRTKAVATAKAEASAKVHCEGAADNAPVVNIMGSPAHLYVNGNAAIWIEAFDSDGDAVNVSVSASGAGWVAGLVPSDVRWDGTPCPSGKSCYRATAWAGATPGNMTVTATVTAGGKDASDSVTFPVVADDF